MERERFLYWLEIYLKGFAMGLADAVPGVSGGTIALITGVYERLISAITSVDIDSILIFLRGVTPSGFREAFKEFKDLDGFFLMVLGSGIITAVVTVLNLMHYFLSRHPVPTYGFFFGLIAVSAVVLYRQVDLSTAGRKVAALSGLFFSFMVSGHMAATVGNSPLMIFIAGAVAITAMILPGISGSLILIILGQYEFMTAALSRFTDALLAAEGIVSTGKPVAFFLSGGLVGLFTVAHSVKWALDNYREATFAILVSMVLGALRAPVVEVEKSLAEQGLVWIQVIPEFGASAVLGGLLVFLLDRKAGIIEN